MPRRPPRYDVCRPIGVDGDSAQLILQEYPFLEPEDVQACLVFAHRSLAGEQVHERMPVRVTDGRQGLWRTGFRAQAASSVPPSVLSG